MEYGEVYLRLAYEVAEITFIKKNGDFRHMLCTRNLDIVRDYFKEGGVEGFGYHDRKCNINNGNIAVIDLAIGEARSFNIDRLRDIIWSGPIKNSDDFDMVYCSYLSRQCQIEKLMQDGNLESLDLQSMDVVPGLKSINDRVSKCLSAELEKAGINKKDEQNTGEGMSTQSAYECFSGLGRLKI